MTKTRQGHGARTLLGYTVYGVTRKDNKVKLTTSSTKEIIFVPTPKKIKDTPIKAFPFDKKENNKYFV